MILSQYREKWREAPKGSDTDGRVFSTDLLKLSDEQLLVQWETMAARRYEEELRWVGFLYRDTFRGRRVLELGSGLGFDGLRFASWGAEWTFADIVPDNLMLIERIATLKGLRTSTKFHLIPDSLTFAGVADNLDAIWVFGSIHHVPFEIARQEALNALHLLKVGGRWIELVYPRERWLREGSLPFNEWGKLTDGERTPWVEWHDVEKVRQRLEPARFRTILDFQFCSHNYQWIDLQYEGMGEQPISSVVNLLEEPIRYLTGTERSWLGKSVTCPRGLFAEALHVPLAHRDEAVVDLEVHVTEGTVGIGLIDAQGVGLPGAEFIAEAGADSRRATLRGRQARTLVIRNLHARRRGRFELMSLRQR
jgi:hypothetical protein